MARQKKSKQKIDPSIWVILIGGLMLVVAVVVLVIQAQQPAQSAVATQNSFVPYPEVERVTIQDAKAAYDAGTAVFVECVEMSCITPVISQVPYPLLILKWIHALQSSIPMPGLFFTVPDRLKNPAPVRRQFY